VAGGLRLYGKLLPVRERVLGPDHPSTLNIRKNIASLTARHSDVAGAVRLFRDLLADQERVLGPHHPSTRMTRTDIANCSGMTADQKRGRVR
jgi:hypothetical protein